MRIDSDWHIHTHCSCDSACLEFEALVRDAEIFGIRDFGVSDHFHSRLQEADIAASRREYEKTLEAHPELKGHFHFGMEASVLSAWELDKIARGDYTGDATYGLRAGGPEGAALALDFDDEFIDKYKIEYVITGVHWPMYCKPNKEVMIREYHRQYMYAVENPNTTILAHYLWWSGYRDMGNPFLDFSVIPHSMLEELKAALLENHVTYEINLESMILDKQFSESFLDEYLGWAAELQRSGVTLAIGSDCHFPSLRGRDDSGKVYSKSEKLLERSGITSEGFFRL